MVTASHNDNGWTGVKMGANRPAHLGPDEMNRLKEIVLDADFKNKVGGSYQFHENFPARYIGRPHQAPKLKRKAEGGGRLRQRDRGSIRAAGDAGDRLRSGAARYRTRPHLSEIQSQSRRHWKCCTPFATRCWSTRPMWAWASTATATAAAWSTIPGEEIFADKVGVMLARDMSAITKNAQFVVDVKSTGLFVTDPVLQKQGAKTTYWKTGHSYMKRRTNELGALAGFEKSGHFFFNAPLGRGYDDGLISAIAGLRDARSCARQVDGGPERRAAENLVVADDVAALCRRDQIRRRRQRGEAFEAMQSKAEKVAGQPIRDLVTVNGVRVTVEDGSWGLVRASSNKPELVVVVESSGQRAAHARPVRGNGFGYCAPIPKSGEYNQKI